VIPVGVRVFLCVEPVDMRLGFDRLAQLARERVGNVTPSKAARSSSSAGAGPHA
jgi:hypothetical protein